MKDYTGYFDTYCVYKRKTRTPINILDVDVYEFVDDVMLEFGYDSEECFARKVSGKWLENHRYLQFVSDYLN